MINAELFIAFRYFFSRKKLNFITIISYLSFGGITIGVAALIIVMSVYNGFSGLVSSFLISLDPHIRVEAVSPKGAEQIPAIYDTLTATLPGAHITRYASGKVLIFSGRRYQIFEIMGVERHALNSVYGIQQYMVAGEKPAPNDDGTGVIGGYALMDWFDVLPGDTVTAVSPRGLESAYLKGGLPLSAKLHFVGAFKSGNNSYDAGTIFCDLPVAQMLMEYGDNFQGYEIRLNSLDEAIPLAEVLQEKFNKEDISVNTWYDLHKQLFTVMKIERMAAMVILSLIVAVAVFNILASLAMSVIEKKRDIGILQAMGMHPSRVKKVFVYQGIIAGVIGTLLGFAIGLLVYWLQITYKIYPLDPTRFKIDAMPMQIEWLDFVVTGFIAVGLSILASLIPAKRAASINALDAIRWE
ncbi:MAG: ABC transporter permease [Ignavibacteriales bacterium]|nr:ABC transporter permease [Ignavibacteriales bacterium]